MADKMMMRLTTRSLSDTLLLSPLHVVAVVGGRLLSDGARSSAEVLTTPGVVYQVKETVDEVQAEMIRSLEEGFT